MNILITVPINDLTRQSWDFHASLELGGKFVMRLDEWRTETRATKRHKWAPSGEGYRRRLSDGHQWRGWQLPAAQVPFPDEVVNQAKAILMESLIVAGPRDPEKKA